MRAESFVLVLRQRGIPMNIRLLTAKFVMCGLLVAGMAAPSAALAAEEELAPGFNACMNRSSATTDMVACYDSAYKFWDNILNKNYKKAMKNCEENGTPECKANLKKAQRAWIQYKEGMSDYIYNSSDGSMSRLSAIGFLTEETKKQAQLLRTSSN